MKKALLILVFFLLISGAGEFCRGFRDGFEDGYCCDVSYDCISPPPPPCPTPPPGKDNYNDGYGIGYKTGCEKSY